MSRPLAWSSFRALITGGMNAPSDGALKTRMESFSSVCAWDGAAASPTTSAAAHEICRCRIEIIVFLRRRPCSRKPEKFLCQPTVDRGDLIGFQPGGGDDLQRLVVADRERHV